MATVHDVAAYILQNLGKMTAMKLQKLLYYSQAWSLVWDERPLFDSRIEAWANGPVLPEVYKVHKGMFEVGPTWPNGSAAAVAGDSAAKETVDAVLGFYGDKTSQWLSDLTHQEKPWIDARKGLDPGESGEQEITLAAMAEYYGSLAPGGPQA